MTLKVSDNTKVLAGFRGEKCLALCSMDYGQESIDRFKERCAKRELQVREVTFKEALKGAAPGFKQSIRFLRQSMENRREMRSTERR